MIFSIIINCFNGEQFLSDCLTSIKNQTFTDFEIVFVDNASTDQSLEILSEFKFENLTLVSLRDKVSLGHARNIAIENCKGRLISFLDCDDLYTPDRLNIIYKHIMPNEENIGVCFGSFQIMDSDKIAVKHVQHKTCFLSKPYEKLCMKNFINLQTVTIDTSIIPKNKLKFDVELNICEEYDLFLRLSRSYNFMSLTEILASYRVHGNMTTINLRPTYAGELLHIYERLLSDASNKSDASSYIRIQSIARGLQYAIIDSDITLLYHYIKQLKLADTLKIARYVVKTKL